MADSDDIPREGSLEAEKWFKAVNKEPGIAALSIAACFVVKKQTNFAWLLRLVFQSTIYLLSDLICICI